MANFIANSTISKIDNQTIMEPFLRRADCCNSSPLSLQTDIITMVPKDIPEKNISITNNDSYYYYSSYEEFGWSKTGTFQDIVANINRYVMPIIIIAGVLGNLMCFTVFVNTHLKFQSCSIYLAFLNIVDTLFLMCLFVGWLGWWDIFVFHIHGWCQVVIYTSYVTSFLSAWGVVSFTVERYIVVYHPLRKRILCTRYKAILVVSIFSASALLFYSFSLVSHGITPDVNYGEVCMTFPEYDLLLRVMTVIDTIVTLVLPALMIVTLNIAITLKIWDFIFHLKERESNAMTSVRYQDEGSTRTKRNGVNTSQSSASILSYRLSRQAILIRDEGNRNMRRNMQLRTTRSLLVVSTAFVAFTMPSHSLRIHMIVHFLLFTDTPYTDHLQRWQQILQLFSYLNYSGNFLLYCACSRSFRTALQRMVARWKRSLSKRSTSVWQCLRSLRIDIA